MNKKAIIVYVDNNSNGLDEYMWLYKSWYINKLYKEYDVIVYCNPRIEDQIPKHPNVITRKMVPVYEIDDFWKEYKFVNSFAMFNDASEIEWISKKYDFLLKTDADVFLTENLLGLNPSKTIIGMGGYMQDCTSEEVKLNLDRIRNNLNLNDSGINHIGASIFGKTDIVLTIVRNHFVVTKYILSNEWKDGNGKWPCWFKGVCSMYAIHLVVNHFLNIQSINLWGLDDLCWQNDISKNTYHIHAWHSHEDFSKHKWFEGYYSKFNATTTPKIAKDYCLWIASNSLEELLEVNQN